MFFVDARDNGNAVSLRFGRAEIGKGSTRQSPKAILDVGNAVIPSFTAPLFASLFGDESGCSSRWCAASHSPGAPDDK